MTRDEAQARLFLAAGGFGGGVLERFDRFSDGGEFGFGAEMGISTQKLHCRGPFALAELTSAKYRSKGQRPDTLAVVGRTLLT